MTFNRIANMYELPCRNLSYVLNFPCNTTCYNLKKEVFDMNTPTFSFSKIIFLIIYFMLYIPFFIRIISHKPLEFGLFSHILILFSFLAITILNYKKKQTIFTIIFASAILLVGTRFGKLLL